MTLPTPRSVGLRRARPRNRPAFHLFDDGARNSSSASPAQSERTGGAGGVRVAIYQGRSNVICYRGKKSIKEKRFKGPRKS
jgi:hypothetical protein